MTAPVNLESLFSPLVGTHGKHDVDFGTFMPKIQLDDLIFGAVFLGQGYCLENKA